MTETDCLQYCYDRGYNWGGLYEHFKRVSCWCCPLQSLEELRQLYKYYPELWQKLKEWDKRTWRNFRADYSVVNCTPKVRQRDIIVMKLTKGVQFLYAKGDTQQAIYRKIQGNGSRDLEEESQL